MVAQYFAESKPISTAAGVAKANNVANTDVGTAPNYFCVGNSSKLARAGTRWKRLLRSAAFLLRRGQGQGGRGCVGTSSKLASAKRSETRWRRTSELPTCTLPVGDGLRIVERSLVVQSL